MIQNLLNDRSKTHGNFEDNAQASQALKAALNYYHTSEDLTAVQAEALDAICAKIARVITGDPNHVDSWVDIAGYATLVANNLKEGGYDD